VIAGLRQVMGRQIAGDSQLMAGDGQVICMLVQVVWFRVGTEKSLPFVDSFFTDIGLEFLSSVGRVTNG
jgi:hypothetical protein